MGSEVFPVIDLAGHNDWPRALGGEIVEACKNWGFMVLTGHGIPQQDSDAMFDLHKEFCEQDLATKAEKVVDHRQIGYDLKNSRVGVNECMVFGGTAGEILQGDNVPSWWDTDKRAAVEAFKSKAQALGVKLLAVFAEAFGLPSDYFAAAHHAGTNPGSVLRMLHYPKMSAMPMQNFPRLHAHTDWGSVTFVWAQSGGLEVQTPQKEWMSVPVIPGSVIVNIGDAMSLWSGQTLKSTLHRISFDNLPIDQDRWSMAFFLNANTQARLEVLRREADGRLLEAAADAPVLTMGEYQQVRMYLSQKEDASNNWIGRTGIPLEPYQKYVRAVEGLGVANGTGLADYPAVH